MTDSDVILYEWLTEAGSALYELVGSRVWCPVIPPCSVWVNDSPGIVFRRESESAHLTGASFTVMYQFRCFGGSKRYSDARNVYQKLFDRLHNARGVVTSGRLVLAVQVGALDAPPDPETGYVHMQARYRIITGGV